MFSYRRSDTLVRSSSEETIFFNYRFRRMVAQTSMDNAIVEVRCMCDFLDSAQAIAVGISCEKVCRGDNSFSSHHHANTIYHRECTLNADSRGGFQL
jgi:hypothetical protein